MKALVTGGAGFIGGHIARDLCRRGAEVTVVDNLRTGDLRNIPDAAKFFNLYVGNDDLSKIWENGFDIVYHFAGQSSVEISYSDPLYDLNTNCRSTLHLLDLCVKNKTSRFIFASTMSVYGGEGTMPKVETSPRDGQNFYAISKKASEDYLNLYEKLGVNSTALRLFNIYGPGQNLGNLRQGMLSIYLAQALDCGKVVVKGDTSRTRDFVYIDDVINAINSIESNSKSFGKSINICSGIEVTVKKAIEIIAATLDADLEIEIANGTPGDIARMVGCPSLLEQISGFKCSTTLELGLKQMVDSFRAGDYFN